MALALGIRYLTGRAVATDAFEYEAAEWPPHPARIFMAMACAHFETDGDAAEADALRWLAEQGPPELHAAEADPRHVVTTFVPVNDDPIGKKGSQLQTPAGWVRVKQPRCFPSVRPHHDTVFAVWPDASPDGRMQALDSLCRRVTRVGHSSSLVQMWAAEEADAVGDVWRPVEEGFERRMRVASSGLLKELADAYSNDERPSIGLWQGYRRAEERRDEPCRAIWSEELFVFRIAPLESRHARLGLISTLALTRRMHDAMLSAAERLGTIPEWMSGHAPGGEPSERPHIACFPLAFVDHRHADGHLLGVAIATPREISAEDRRHALRALAGVEELRLGPLGRWRVIPEDADSPPHTLRSSAWTGGRRGAARWATVTPVVFDRHPKSRDRAAYEEEAEAIVRRSCVRIGLPEPRSVILTPVSAHLGAPASHEFPRMTRKDGAERRHRHAILLFDRPVRGPIAIGAGRHRGYGFCRPLSAEE